MTRALAILAVFLVASSAHAGLWQSGFSVGDPPEEASPTAVPEVPKVRSYEAAGWALMFAGGLLAYKGYTRDKDVFDETGFYTEDDPDWLLVISGAAIALAGGLLMEK